MLCDSLPGFADIVLAPHAARMFILKHYRDFEVPKTEEFKNFHNWWELMAKSVAYLKTKAKDEDLIKRYERYAKNTYPSQVAKAINEGTQLP